MSDEKAFILLYYYQSHKHSFALLMMIAFSIYNWLICRIWPVVTYSRVASIFPFWTTSLGDDHETIGTP